VGHGGSRELDPRPEVSLVRLIYVFVLPSQRKEPPRTSQRRPLCTACVLTKKSAAPAAASGGVATASVVLHMQKTEAEACRRRICLEWRPLRPHSVPTAPSSRLGKYCVL